MDETIIGDGSNPGGFISSTSHLTEGKIIEDVFGGKTKYRCTKGHAWEGTFLGNGNFHIDFSMPGGEQRVIKDLCLVCLHAKFEELLKDVGRVSQVS